MCIFEDRNSWKKRDPTVIDPDHANDLLRIERELREDDGGDPDGANARRHQGWHSGLAAKNVA